VGKLLETALNPPLWARVWGEVHARLARARHQGKGHRQPSWVDLFLALGVIGVLYGLRDFAREWAGALAEPVAIDLSPWALPGYTFFSLSRGLLAYVLSLGFTLAYGYWAAKDPVAERLLIPLLDILQSIPVLSFLPGLVLMLVLAFPSSRIGLELAAILTIFTAQAWNMTFSFYHSVRSVPQDQREVATVYRFGLWQLFKWVELPFAAVGLIWNSMMSMAGGWVFLMINESFKLEDHDFRLPGVGSYMSQALEERRVDAILWAILAMIVMIVALDQLLWRPVVVWAQKFRVEEGGATETASSWFLTWLRRSRLVRLARRLLRKVGWWWSPTEMRNVEGAASGLETTSRDTISPPRHPTASRPHSRWANAISLGPLLFLVLVLGYGGYKLVMLLRQVSGEQWMDLAGAAGLTFGRVALAVVLATLWTVPAGLAIGLSPRLARLLQPVVQVVASFPAPLVFPLIALGLQAIGVTLGWGSVLLMLLGTQWYVLFNVIAGAMAIPADLREAARSYRLPRGQLFWTLYAPAIFPYLVTGWVTATGGAWNLSIVAEYDVTSLSGAAPAWGLGAAISKAFAEHEWPLLAAATLVMAVLVVGCNQLLWRRCYRLAEGRYALNK
jgi:NitT/TauT family transport system permease protein